MAALLLFFLAAAINYCDKAAMAAQTVMQDTGIIEKQDIPTEEILATAQSEALSAELYATRVSDCHIENGQTACTVTIEMHRNCDRHLTDKGVISMCVLDIKTNWSTCFDIPACEVRTNLVAAFDGPMATFCAWLQTSPTGPKLEGSDVFFVMDMRISESAGFDIVYSGEYFRKNALQTPLVLGMSSVAPHATGGIELDFLYPGVAAAPELIVQQSIKHFLQRNPMQDDTTYFRARASARVIFQYVWSNMHSFPPVQTMPSPQQPFVFFHIDKCAGSSIRNMLDAAAWRRGLVSFIPCYGPVQCNTFAIPRVCRGMPALPMPQTHSHMQTLASDEHSESSSSTSVPVSTDTDAFPLPQSVALWDDSSYASGCPVDFDRASVIAGHFAWNDVWAALRPRGRAADSASTVKSERAHDNFNSSLITRSSLRPTCLVMGRNPISRVMSYFYQRCYNTSACPFYMQHINDIDIEPFREWLRRFRSGDYDVATNSLIIIDEGTSDAACRQMMSRRVMAGVIADSVSLKRYPLAIPPEMYAEATANADRCVIGLQEDWARTEVVLNHWLPWMDFDASIRELHFHDGESRPLRPSDLREELRAAIEDVNRCDLHLYEHMRSRFDAMWKHAVGFS